MSAKLPQPAPAGPKPPASPSPDFVYGTGACASERDDAEIDQAIWRHMRKHGPTATAGSLAAWLAAWADSVKSRRSTIDLDGWRVTIEVTEAP